MEEDGERIQYAYDHFNIYPTLAESRAQARAKAKESRRSGKLRSYTRTVPVCLDSEEELISYRYEYYAVGDHYAEREIEMKYNK